MNTSMKEISHKLAVWHSGLTGNGYRSKDGAEVLKDASPNTAALAELRRAAIVDDVMLSAAFGELVAMLPEKQVGKNTVMLLARAAYILVRVDRCSYASSLPLLMASAGNTDKAPVSTLRANNLFRIEQSGDACIQIASILPLLGGRSSVELDPNEILWAMHDWDRTRRNWANTYHVAVARKKNLANTGA